MANIGKLWAGRVFGTNTGNVFVELKGDDKNLSGVLRFNDSALGLVVYDVSGSFDGTKLNLKGDATQSPPGVQTGHIKIEGGLAPQGHIRGQWISTLGTGGTFELYPHDAAPDQSAKSSIPEQLYSSRIPVGAVRLYPDDVRDTIEAMRKDFIAGSRIVATYKVGGVDTTKYLEDFWQEAAKLDELRYLKLAVQEPEAHGINRLVMIELDSLGGNGVLVQGIYESWVIGKAETIARQLRRYEQSSATNIRRLGIGLNQLIAFGALVAIPEIAWPWLRIGFVAALIAIVAAFNWTHRRFLPNAVIHMAKPSPGILERAWPSILSWLMAATASLAAAYVFYLLTRPTGL